MFQIETNQDVRAQYELARLKEGGSPNEALRTYEISRVADFGDKKIVFTSYMHKGQKRKRLLSFEKDLESKLWIPTYVSVYDVRKTNEQLAKEMEAWTGKDLD